MGRDKNLLLIKQCKSALSISSLLGEEVYIFGNIRLISHASPPSIRFQHVYHSEQTAKTGAIRYTYDSGAHDKLLRSQPFAV